MMIFSIRIGTLILNKISRLLHFGVPNLTCPMKLEYQINYLDENTVTIYIRFS